MPKGRLKLASEPIPSDAPITEQLFTTNPFDLITSDDLVFDVFWNVYVTGIFFDTVDFDPGPGQDLLISSTWSSAFVAKYDSLGNYLWAKQFEGDVTEYGLTLDVDSLGHVYVGGYFYEGMITN